MRGVNCDDLKSSRNDQMRLCEALVFSPQLFALTHVPKSYLCSCGMILMHFLCFFVREKHKFTVNFVNTHGSLRFFANNKKSWLFHHFIKYLYHIFV